jgi:hypothetical protein
MNGKRSIVGRGAKGIAAGLEAEGGVSVSIVRDGDDKHTAPDDAQQANSIGRPFFRRRRFGPIPIGELRIH